MRRVSVKVVPNAKRSKVLEEGGRLKVKVRAPPDKGRANDEVVEVLAEHFGVRKGDVRIVKGTRSREKVVEIDD